MTWILTFFIITLLITFGWVNQDEKVLIELFATNINFSVLEACLYLSAILIGFVVTYRGLHYIISTIIGVQKKVLPFLNQDLVTYIEDFIIATTKKDAVHAKKIASKILSYDISPKLELIIKNEVELLEEDVEKIILSFEAMLGCKDTMNSALEGLILAYIEKEEWDTAHQYSLQLWQIAPSDWLASIYIYILLNGEMWLEILGMTKKILPFISVDSINDIKLIACYNLANHYYLLNDFNQAYKFAFQGYKKYKKDFLPLNILLLTLLLQMEKYREFKSTLKEAWSIAPHLYLLEKVLNNPIDGLDVLALVKEVTIDTMHLYDSLISLSMAAIKSNLYYESLKFAQQAYEIRPSLKSCLLIIECNYYLNNSIANGVNCLQKVSRMDNDLSTICYYWNYNTNRLTDDPMGNNKFICSF